MRRWSVRLTAVVPRPPAHTKMNAVRWGTLTQDRLDASLKILKDLCAGLRVCPGVHIRGVPIDDT